MPGSTPCSHTSASRRHSHSTWRMKGLRGDPPRSEIGRQHPPRRAVLLTPEDSALRARGWPGEPWWGPRSATPAPPIEHPLASSPDSSRQSCGTTQRPLWTSPGPPPAFPLSPHICSALSTSGNSRSEAPCLMPRVAGVWPRGSPMRSTGLPQEGRHAARQGQQQQRRPLFAARVAGMARARDRQGVDGTHRGEAGSRRRRIGNVRPVAPSLFWQADRARHEPPTRQHGCIATLLLRPLPGLDPLGSLGRYWAVSQASGFATVERVEGQAGARGGSRRMSDEPTVEAGLSEVEPVAPPPG
jgi:hypothetical protein